MELTKREQEAYELVNQLNRELDEKFGGAEVCFSFVATEFVFAVHWGDICVWDSENSPSYDDNDKEIPIEVIVRHEMKTIAEQAEWVTRKRCCHLDCTGDGGANACIETLEKPDVQAS